MPFKLCCSGCGAVLLEIKTATEWDYLIAYSSDWYGTLFSELNGHCPKCGHVLPRPCEYGKKLSVEVLAVECSQNMGIEDRRNSKSKLNFWRRLRLEE